MSAAREKLIKGIQDAMAVSLSPYRDRPQTDDETRACIASACGVPIEDVTKGEVDGEWLLAIPVRVFLPIEPGPRDGG